MKPAPEISTLPDGPTPAETLKQGADIVVVFNDGQERLIRILQLPIRMMEALLVAQGDEPKLILLYTGQTEEWLDEVTPTSQEEIVKEGDRINADFFGRWFQRRLDRQEKLAPGSKARLLSLFSPPPELLPLPTLQPPRPVPVG